MFLLRSLSRTAPSKTWPAEIRSTGATSSASSKNVRKSRSDPENATRCPLLQTNRKVGQHVGILGGEHLPGLPLQVAEEWADVCDRLAKRRRPEASQASANQWPEVVPTFGLDLQTKRELGRHQDAEHQTGPLLPLADICTLPSVLAPGLLSAMVRFAPPLDWLGESCKLWPSNLASPPPPAIS